MLSALLRAEKIHDTPATLGGAHIHPPMISVARKRDWVKPKLPWMVRGVGGAQRLDPKGPGLRGVPNPDELAYRASSKATAAGTRWEIPP